MRIRSWLAVSLLVTLPAAATARPQSADYPTDGWKTPTTLDKLPAADVDALLRAGGYTRTAEGWSGCDGMAQVSPAESRIADLNGDGRPEAVIVSTGLPCYGGTETGFHILTPVAGGWKTITDEPGVPTFLDARGAEGFPDIEVGGPGFCFPVERWDGHEYRMIRRQYDGKPCTGD